MLASLALMFITIGVRVPLVAFIGMSVMCLVKTRLINGLGHALHSYEEHRGDHQFENNVTHLSRLQKMDSRVQMQFTEKARSVDGAGLVSW